MQELTIGLFGFAADGHIGALAAALEDRGAKTQVLTPLPWGRYAYRDGRYFHNHRSLDHLRALFRRHTFIPAFDVVHRNAAAVNPAAWLAELARLENQVTFLNAMQRHLTARGCFLMNPLAAGEPAKQIQGELAQACGWRVPKTLITNSSGEAMAALAEGGEWIVKPPAGGALVQRADDTVRAALRHLDQPVALQEFIDGADIRVYWAAGEVLAAGRIETAGLDYRRDPDYARRVTAQPLPDEARERTSLIFKKLGLFCGSMDLRLTPEGEFVFLEVNSGGSFMELERALGVPIAARLADLLIDGARAAPVTELPEARLPVSVTLDVESAKLTPAVPLYDFEAGAGPIVAAVAGLAPAPERIEIEFDAEQRARLLAEHGIRARRGWIDLRSHRLEPIVEEPEG